MSTIEISTPSGRLRGERVPSGAVFRGIPFALAPFGSLRLRPPQPVPAWDGVRDATTFGDAYPQPVIDASMPGNAHQNPTSFGEDCLNLNVWTPDPATSGLPVMVWIHGGGFMTGGGAAPLNSGDTWARDGVVYVTINYRMHVDGFLYLGGETANLGLQDQVAALRWVQDNITSFGGDPGNVTVLGQSAGAVSVMHLLTMPTATGLFRRAISQSGSGMVPTDLAFEQRVAARVAEILGVEPTFEGIASVPVERAASAMASLAIEYLSPALWGRHAFEISAFRPFVDGVVLPDHVVPAVAAGASADVDLLVGTTRDEMTFAMLPLGLLGDDPVPPFWSEIALETFGLDAADLDAYRKGSRAGAPEAELLMAAWTDWAFRIPSIRVLEAHAGRSHCYEVTWPSPMPHVGATHALELPFTNDGLDAFVAAFGDASIVGQDPPQALADRMHADWVRFASTGDPGWPEYDTSTRATMRYDETSAVVDDLAGTERELWDGKR